MTPLIDATEMYLRTVWELSEEGVDALRARLVERLHVSAPSVSETVARLQAEGLLELGANRALALTSEGERIALSVMRKHRLAEVLLQRVIGLDWVKVHTEACRWEHVMSDEVEARLEMVLDHPATGPYGNPIPGSGHEGPSPRRLAEVADAGAGEPVEVTLDSFSEHVQADVAILQQFDDLGLRPGYQAAATSEGSTVRLETTSGTTKLEADTADLIRVAP